MGRLLKKSGVGSVLVTAFASAFVLAAGLLLTGCSGNGENGAGNKAEGSTANGSVSDALTWELPSLSEFDENMSQAHFIGAPESFSDVTLSEGYSDWATDYTLSYDVLMDGGSAGFLLSDGSGQYGNIEVLRLNDYDGECSFEVASMKGGFLSSETLQSEVKFPSAGNYHVTAVVTGSSALVSVNNLEMGSFKIDGFPLGSVGVYNSRGAADYRIDNILVTAEGGKVLYSEDFDNPSGSIFSPYYIKTVDGSLQVRDGVLLTRLEGAPAPVFMKEFKVDSTKIENVYLYLASLGAFEASVNGTKVSEDYLDPGQPAWADCLNYVAYDITGLLNSGFFNKTNRLEITLLHGFYDRGQSYPENFYTHGDTLALKGEVVVKYRNGDVEIIPTDDSFKVSADGPVRFDDIYQGEIIDDTHMLSDDSFVAVVVDAVDEKYLGMPVEPKETVPASCVPGSSVCLRLWTELLRHHQSRPGGC